LGTRGRRHAGPGGGGLASDVRVPAVAVTRRPPAWRAVAAAALTVACGGAQPAPFPRDEPIRLGPLELTVLELEPVPSPPPVPLSSLRAHPGARPLAVFVEWAGLDGMAESERSRFLESFLEEGVTLTDADGAEYRAMSALTRPMYSIGDTRGMIGGTVPHDWVVVFHVAEDAREFALLVENPEPDGGGPELARVDLGTPDLR
jgi:hypothetical protein